MILGSFYSHILVDSFLPEVRTESSILRCSFVNSYNLPFLKNSAFYLNKAGKIWFT